MQGTSLNIFRIFSEFFQNFFTIINKEFFHHHKQSTNTFVSYKKNTCPVPAVILKGQYYRVIRCHKGWVTYCFYHILELNNDINHFVPMWIIWITCSLAEIILTLAVQIWFKYWYMYTLYNNWFGLLHQLSQQGSHLFQSLLKAVTTSSLTTTNIWYFH